MCMRSNIRIYAANACAADSSTDLEKRLGVVVVVGFGAHFGQLGAGERQRLLEVTVLGRHLRHVPL